METALGALGRPLPLYQPFILSAAVWVGWKVVLNPCGLVHRGFVVDPGNWADRLILEEFHIGHMVAFPAAEQQEA